jgi:Zn-dependent peptidase ImmA (M78 family)
MIPIELEDIVDTLAAVRVINNRHIEGFGLYDPSTFPETIFYNARNIPTERQFYLTILHEIAHYLEEPGLSHYTSEFLAESRANDTAEDENILAYLGAYFEKEVERHWG